jgi:hypothetical protein
MEKKLAVLVYHKNIKHIYPAEWVRKFKDSILNQTFKEYKIFEVNYGYDDYRIFENSEFESKPFENFVYALNYLLDKAFSLGFQAAANTNADDHYSFSRFEKQLQYINAGYDLVSSNFSLVKEDKVTVPHYFDNLDIRKQLAINHNIICHPVVMYSSKFMQRNRYDVNAIPFEDMYLWQKTMWDYRFVILPDVLCYHRLHDNSIGHNLKEN